jgi:hypothetical protein
VILFPEAVAIRDQPEMGIAILFPEAAAVCGHPEM